MNKIIAKNFDYSLLANSELNNETLSGSSAFNVKNSAGFQNFIVLGEQGDEQTEILPIDSISTDTINTSIPSSFDHSGKVYCSFYDQIQLFKASAIGGVEPSDVDFSDIEIKEIDLENLVTYFEDDLGDDDSRYKIKYRNSTTTDVSDFHEIITDTKRDYCTVAYVKNMFNIVESDYKISSIIEAVSDFIDMQMGVTDKSRIFFKDVEELLDTDRYVRSYFPKNTPIQSINEIMIMDKGAEVDVFTEHVYKYDYFIKLDEAGNLATRPQGMRLKMTVGHFDEAPADLQLLCAKMVNMEFMKTQGDGVRGNISAEKIGRYRVEFEGGELVSLGFYDVIQPYTGNLTFNAI